MNILAMDTSMGACSVAVLGADGTALGLHAREALMARGHAEALMPMVQEVLAKAGISAPELDLIAATVGPGSFTGVRIAIAAARGLALATGAKLYGTDSLTVMARDALGRLSPKGPFAVAVDAHRGMIYLGIYDEAGEQRDGPLLIAPVDAAELVPRDLIVAVGSGAALLAESCARQRRHIETALPELQPSAASLAKIALEVRATVPILRPLYLRPADARPQQPGVARR
ncbi:MAG TPA: tRNA (adenosine(37)-N6)-threonylcarbamoyltransferase complex dimerization subunit type 1 TsaB [Methyloceanibacter sp.]|nr:tRNA (adenosine(37)-N6)-threonylcarbamoyltransferase complex dimerization subunit type 1 TsaB [Methyloceanibacter sp.]